MLLGPRSGDVDVPVVRNMTWWATPCGKVHHVGVLHADHRRRFDVPTVDVLSTIKEFGYQDGQYNLSPMVNHVHRFFGEAWRSPEGLRVFGVFVDASEAGPHALKARGQEWQGLIAKSILDTVMWPSDRSAFDELLDDYPGHVVEFTACWRAHGTVLNRNVIIWEVRTDDGSYEKWR